MPGPEHEASLSDAVYYLLPIVNQYSMLKMAGLFTNRRLVRTLHYLLVVLFFVTLVECI